jgi:hypothetical protein
VTAHGRVRTFFCGRNCSIEFDTCSCLDFETIAGKTKADIRKGWAIEGAIQVLFFSEQGDLRIVPRAEDSYLILA